MKKKLLSFIITIAVVLATGICLTACGGGHKTFDMFNKSYKISSTATYELTFGNSDQTVTDWEGYIKDNYGNIKDSEGEYNSAETLIAHIKSQVASNKFIKGATITISEGQIEGNQKVGTLTVTQGDLATPITLQIKAEPNKEYEDEYTFGTLYKDGAYAGGITVSCNAKAEILDVQIWGDTIINNQYSANFCHCGFELKDGTSCTVKVSYLFYK